MMRLVGGFFSVTDNRVRKTVTDAWLMAWISRGEQFYL